MKVSKLIIISCIYLVPVLANAQVITSINENNVTFTIPNISLDSAKVNALKETLEIEISKQLRDNKQPKEDSKVSNNDNKGIVASDIVRDEKYIYALDVHNTYDDDYGLYYYSEWKITQYLISTGQKVAETNYNEGLGIFSSFKELEAQKDFGPVKRCELAQLVFQIMRQQ